MSARGRDEQRPQRSRVPPHVAEVGRVLAVGSGRLGWWTRLLLPAEDRRDLAQPGGRQDPQLGHERRLGAFLRRAMSRPIPARAAPSAIARAPRPGRSSPPSDSSPSTRRVLERGRRHLAEAARTPQAIARSKPAPVLRTCAGARLTTTRRWGNVHPAFCRAARTRSRASRTAVSPSPTIANAGRPWRMSTSTVTSRDSMPRRAKVRTRASMGRCSPGACAADARFVTARARRDEARVSRASGTARLAAMDPATASAVTESAWRASTSSGSATRSSPPTTARASASSTSWPATGPRSSSPRSRPAARGAGPRLGKPARGQARPRAPHGRGVVAETADRPRDERAALRRDRRDHRSARAARRARAPRGGVLRWPKNCTNGA